MKLNHHSHKLFPLPPNAGRAPRSREKIYIFSSGRAGKALLPVGLFQRRLVARLPVGTVPDFLIISVMGFSWESLSQWYEIVYVFPAGRVPCWHYSRIKTQLRSQDLINNGFPRSLGTLCHCAYVEVLLKIELALKLLSQYSKWRCRKFLGLFIPPFENHWLWRLGMECVVVLVYQ